MRKYFYFAILVLMVFCLCTACKKKSAFQQLKGDTKSITRDIGHATKNAVKKL